MNSKRFKEILDNARDIPEDKFDMKYWWNEDCGCVIGHYCRTNDTIKLSENYLPYPVFGGNTDIDAVCDYLDLAYKDAKWLFLAQSYKDRFSKIEVLARMESYLLGTGEGYEL